MVSENVQGTEDVLYGKCFVSFWQQVTFLQIEPWDLTVV